MKIQTTEKVLTHRFFLFLDDFEDMPKLYNGWFNEQISKQASTAVSKALAAGKTKIEVNFPPVPNVGSGNLSLKST